MIKITYQLYGDDFTRKCNNVKHFDNLEQLNDWIAQNYYYHEYYCMGETHHSHIGYYSDRISFVSKSLNPFESRYNYIGVWIEMIENENGVIYTNGEHSKGVRHMSNEIKAKFEEWQKEDKEDPKHLKRLGFNFVD